MLAGLKVNLLNQRLYLASQIKTIAAVTAVILVIRQPADKLRRVGITSYISYFIIFPHNKIGVYLLQFLVNGIQIFDIFQIFGRFLGCLRQPADSAARHAVDHLCRVGQAFICGILNSILLFYGLELILAETPERHTGKQQRLQYDDEKRNDNPCL